MNTKETYLLGNLKKGLLIKACEISIINRRIKE